MILWFSGTGNSRLVATRLSELLGEKTLFIGDSDGRDIPAGKRVVWVFPIYSWGIPPVVSEFIEGVRFVSPSVPHFMVCTCGDDIGLADIMWKKAIEKRGWEATGAYSVQMPNNYTFLPGFDTDSRDVALKKLQSAPQRIADVARSIENSRGSFVSDVVRGSMPWIKTKLLYPLFVRYEVSPKRFRFTTDCIGCGACKSICPMKNIAMENRCPHWGENCAFCLACYHVCPVHAVAYGRRTAAKSQYMAPKMFP